jgi:hypothetical protein
MSGGFFVSAPGLPVTLAVFRKHLVRLGFFLFEL